MKYLLKISKIVSLAFYVFLLYQVWHLCRYGGIQSHLRGIVIGAAGFATGAAICFISGKHGLKQNRDAAPEKHKKFPLTMLVFVLCTLVFTGPVIYTGTPYHGALSRKIDEWVHTRKAALKHNHLFEDGVEGILTDVKAAAALPEELYITNQFLIAFDEQGVIQSIDASLCGTNAHGAKKTYRIEYQAELSDFMTVWIGKDAAGQDQQVQQDMKLSPMMAILHHADWKNQVEEWAATGEQQIYEILYLGRRAFDTAEGLQYVPGDADGDGKETGARPFMQMQGGGKAVGYELSLYISARNDIVPVRYMMEPEYISQHQLDEERQEEQARIARNTERWTVDQADGTMYFFLDDKTGWRLVVTDAAAGSRAYGLDRTEDGGDTWKRIHAHPFAEDIGVAEGLVFFDENFGFAGLAGAAQSHSQLYVTRDGGVTFENIQLPMELVEELPETAKEYGLGIEDYAYLNMPELHDSVLTIMVTTDASESSGIIFQSKDGGVTWEYGE